MDWSCKELRELISILRILKFITKFKGEMIKSYFEWVDFQLKQRDH